MRGLLNAFAQLRSRLVLPVRGCPPSKTSCASFSYMRFDPEGNTQTRGDPVRQIDARLHHALASPAAHLMHVGDPRELGIMTQRLRGKRSGDLRQLGPASRPTKQLPSRQTSSPAPGTSAAKPLPRVRLHRHSPRSALLRNAGFSLGPAAIMRRHDSSGRVSCYTCSSFGLTPPAAWLEKQPGHKNLRGRPPRLRVVRSTAAFAAAASRSALTSQGRLRARGRLQRMPRALTVLSAPSAGLSCRGSAGGASGGGRGRLVLLFAVRGGGCRSRAGPRPQMRTGARLRLRGRSFGRPRPSVPDEVLDAPSPVGRPSS